VGCGHEATALYLACLAEVLTREGYAERARASRVALLQQVERRIVRTLGIPVSDEHIGSHHAPPVWTFERPVREVPRCQPIRIQAGAQGLVHAGVRADGDDAVVRWQRIYDVPLREVAPGRWEATILDGEVDEFTFIWFDHTRSGLVKWEGRNFRVRRTSARHAVGSLTAG
jgi:hypothetical protein